MARLYHLMPHVAATRTLLTAGLLNPVFGRTHNLFSRRMTVTTQRRTVRPAPGRADHYTFTRTFSAARIPPLRMGWFRALRTHFSVRLHYRRCSSLGRARLSHHTHLHTRYTHTHVLFSRTRHRSLHPARIFILPHYPCHAAYLHFLYFSARALHCHHTTHLCRRFRTLCRTHTPPHHCG